MCASFALISCSGMPLCINTAGWLAERSLHEHFPLALGFYCCSVFRMAHIYHTKVSTAINATWIGLNNGNGNDGNAAHTRLSHIKRWRIHCSFLPFSIFLFILVHVAWIPPSRAKRKKVSSVCVWVSDSRKSCRCCPCMWDVCVRGMHANSAGAPSAILSSPKHGILIQDTQQINQIHNIPLLFPTRDETIGR